MTAPPKEWKRLIERNWQITRADIPNINLESCLKDSKLPYYINWKDDNTGFGRTMLICAIYWQRLDIAKSLLRNGASVNETDNDGWTALMYATKNENTEMIQLLLAKGADISIAGRYGETASRLAARHGYTEIVKLFWTTRGYDSKTLPAEWTMLIFNYERDMGRVGIETVLQWMDHPGKEAFINWKHDDFGGRTMLICAAVRGRLDIVRLLLEKGADVTVPDMFGKSPLIVAAIYGHSAIVTLILISMCDNTWETPPGEWPMMIYNHQNYIKNVIGKVDIARIRQWVRYPKTTSFIDWKRDDFGVGRTLLSCAVECGRLDIARLLLEHGAGVNITDKNGWAALKLATRKGYTNIVELLLENGADITITDNTGVAVLDLACSRHGLDDIVKLLLEYGAEVNIADRNGWTPLMKACDNGYTDTVELLLESNADVNAQNSDGMTALHMSCFQGNVSETKLLLNRGANVNAKTKQGHTPLDVASDRNHVDIVWLLVSQQPWLVLERLE